MTHVTEPTSAPAGWLRRSAPLLLLTILLLGPAPGEVGGCGQAEQTLDFETYCRQEKAYECARMDARGEFPGTYADLEACRQAALTTCATSSWPSNCRPFPTVPEGQACIDQLARVSNLRIPKSEIPECDLCP